jgi:ADP-ribosylglycohydrolase
MKIPSLNPQQSRAAGALLGGFIGDAMGVGPHWYYDLNEQHRDYGTWITDYTTPKPDRYHAGLKAGDLSQAGLILKLTVVHEDLPAAMTRRISVIDYQSSWQRFSCK